MANHDNETREALGLTPEMASLRLLVLDFVREYILSLIHI